MRGQVLVADDHPGSLRFVRNQLEAEGYRVSVGSDEDDLLRRLERDRPELMVLGISVPDDEGLSMLKCVRAQSQIPIVVLGETTTSRDVVATLDAGADDYITRPFLPEEFLARVRALLRRSGRNLDSTRDTDLDLGGVIVDLSGSRVLVGGKESRLTPIEWRMLHLLAANLGRVVTYRELLSKIWGSEFVDDVQYLRVWVCRLRRKIGDHSSQPAYLVTVPRLGYRLQRKTASLTIGRNS